MVGDGGEGGDGGGVQLDSGVSCKPWNHADFLKRVR
jgi:hypothetical protein